MAQTPPFVRTRLPFGPPLDVMLAKASKGLPPGEGWLFEPKWDGFRTLIFRDGDQLFLQSRDRKPLRRYFPELDAPLLAQLPDACVLDGELVVVRGSALDFETLQQRIHPARSRIEKLAEETPARFVAFDLLALGERDLRALPQLERRARLEKFLADAERPLHLTPMTRDRALAEHWFERFEGAGLDGVIAKHETLPYQPKKRVLLKIKHVRSCDCVVAGFRWHKDGEGVRVGSLLLGLWDDEGRLQHVGVSASFKAQVREELVGLLAPLREGALEDHPWAGWAEATADGRQPGMQSRWSAGKDLSWVPLRPEKVCEVKFGHMEGGRFRHTASFLRWREDKPAAACTFAQIETVPPYLVRDIFAAD